MIPLNCIIYVIILFVLGFTQVLATNRHMLCKDIEDVFEGNGHLTRPSGAHTVQVGQRGATGVKGEKGEPGMTDLELLKQQIIDEVMEKLQFNATIADINSTLIRIQKEKADVVCRYFGGKAYGDKCYWLILHSKRDVNFSQAEMLCEGGGGEPGDVVDDSHFNIIEGMAQDTMFSSLPHVHIWTGTTINPQFNVIKKHSGERATYTKWIGGWLASTSSHTGVVLMINRNSGSINGMWNYYPSGTVHGVLCQN